MSEFSLLRGNEQNFKALVEAAALAIVITNRVDEIVFINAAAEKLFGYQDQELIGQPVDILIPEVYRMQQIPLAAGTNHAAAEKIPRASGANFVAKVLPKKGAEILVEISLTHITIDGNPLMIYFVIDIRRREEVEDALRKSEARYRQLFEDDLTGNFIIDGTGRIKVCNPAFARIFGIPSPNEARTLNFFDLFPDRASCQQFLAEVKARKKLEFFETQLEHPSGKPLYVLANIVGHFDPTGHLVMIRGYLADVTRRREIESQLLQAQKMESLGILAGSIAHDFNNIISVIQGYTDIILRDMAPDSPLRCHVEKIKQANKQAGLLIQQIQSFSRKQEIQPQVFQINEAIHNIEEMLRRLISKKICLVFDLSRNLPPVKMDPVQVEQVIMNLAVNARDAMLPRGGTLTIRTGAVTLDAKQLQGLETVSPGTFILLEVQDTGIGMDEATRARIFEPFFTTKERDKGTGLGLSIVYGIVNQNKGLIQVESAPGKGTTFRIYFPASSV